MDGKFLWAICTLLFLVARKASRVLVDRWITSETFHDVQNANCRCTGHATMSAERGNYGLIPVHALFFAIGPNQKSLKALVNEYTLLPMMFLGLRKLGNICCGHKMFLNKIRSIFLFSRTQNLYPQQMLRAGKRANIFVGSNVSATMCPRLPGPLAIVVWKPRVTDQRWKIQANTVPTRVTHRTFKHGAIL